MNAFAFPGRVRENMASRPSPKTPFARRSRRGTTPFPEDGPRVGVCGELTRMGSCAGAGAPPGSEVFTHYRGIMQCNKTGLAAV